MPIQMLSECFATAFPQLHSTSKRSLRKGFLSSTEAGGTSYQQQLISDSLRDGFEAMFLFFDFLDFRYLETRILVVKNGVLVDVCVLKSWKTDSTWAVSPKHPVWGNTFCKNPRHKKPTPTPKYLQTCPPSQEAKSPNSQTHRSINMNRLNLARSQWPSTLPRSSPLQCGSSTFTSWAAWACSWGVSKFNHLKLQSPDSPVFCWFYVSSEGNLFESHLPAWQPEVPLKVFGHGREINSPCSLVCAFFPFLSLFVLFLRLWWWLW